MLIILAPSKTLDFERPAPNWVTPTKPLFLDKAATIAHELSILNETELARLMQVSETIAKTNHQRMQHWGAQSKPALWAYRGDVYKGMYADQLTEEDSLWAQAHLMIMSGLYGMVRPYDLISPYRLEMKAKLALDGKKDLYEFWGNDLAVYADSRSDGIICNLASDEYGRPVTRHAKSRIITPVFMDHRPNGRIGPAPIYNKMMRGVMAHWMVKQKVTDPRYFSEFSAHGYVFDAARSNTGAPTYIRDTMKPLVF